MKKHYYNTILAMLERCRTMNELKQIHGLMVTTSSGIKNVIPLSRVIDFCANSEAGDIGYAMSVFRRIEQPSVYIWNSMIRGLSCSVKPVECLVMYREMVRKGYAPDHFTFPFVMKGCCVVGDVCYGKCVHGCIVKTGFELNVYVSVGLLNFYACSADMESARKVFEKTPKWNVVAWASLVSGFISNNQANEAIKVFKDMEVCNVQPNEVTMVNVVVACARSRDIESGKWVHRRICQLGFEFNVILATAIVDMYAKCGSLETARLLFDEMPDRNLVVWNSMIGASKQYGEGDKAIDLFCDMRLAGFVPDEATFLGVIGSCAQLGALALGQSLHSYVTKAGLVTYASIGTTLVDMYTKNGDTGSAKRVFDDLQKKDVMAWTSMIVGLAIHGHAAEALDTFRRMQEDASVIPDQITYIGVLCACSHAGLVVEGQRHFSSMVDVYGITPTAEHYGCMVDLLSRAGRFEEALRLLEEIPSQPSIEIWGALLNGCEIYENVDLADQVRRYITKLQPNVSGVFVLLSNIYAKAGRWEEVKRIRELMKDRMIAKSLGSSSVETKASSS